MNFYELKKITLDASNDNIVKNTIYKLNNIVEECFFYNENVSFGFLLNKIKEDIEYINKNNISFNGISSVQLVKTLETEVQECINSMNNIYSFKKDVFNS